MIVLQILRIDSALRFSVTSGRTLPKASTKKSKIAGISLKTNSKGLKIKLPLRDPTMSKDSRLVFFCNVVVRAKNLNFVFVFSALLLSRSLRSKY